MRKKYSDQEKFSLIRGWRSRIWKKMWDPLTIYFNSEKSKQFLKQNTTFLTNNLDVDTCRNKLKNQLVCGKLFVEPIINLVGKVQMQKKKDKKMAREKLHKKEIAKWWWKWKVQFALWKRRLWCFRFWLQKLCLSLDRRKTELLMTKN